MTSVLWLCAPGWSVAHARTHRQDMSSVCGLVLGGRSTVSEWPDVSRCKRCEKKLRREEGQ